MKKGILFCLVLTLCHGSSLCQSLVGNNVVIDKKLYNDIVNGWSACEDVSSEQRVLISEKDSLIVLKSKESLLKDSLLSKENKKLSECLLALKKDDQTIQELNKALLIPCSKKTNPFLFTPWPYACLAIGFVFGVMASK